MMPRPPLPATDWQPRYEALRRHVLERRQVLGADPLALVILLAQGVAGWMRSWNLPPACPAPVLALGPAPLGPTTPQWQHQLTGLLAQITVRHLWPAPLAPSPHPPRV